jgi:plastocyanin
MSVASRLAQRCSRWLAVVFGVLSVGFVVACSTPAGAAAPPTPVPPAALATLPPPKPIATADPAAGPSVGIENFNYVPADLTVDAGATVVWINHDDVQHTVTASDNSFGSQAIDTDGQFTYTFTTPGAYTYFCVIHPFMTAKVVVH